MNGEYVFRECEVWAIHKKRRHRMLDWFRYRHALHVCIRDRPFALEHPGNHRCACGFGWKPRVTDND